MTHAWLQVTLIEATCQSALDQQLIVILFNLFAASVI